HVGDGGDLAEKPQVVQHLLLRRSIPLRLRDQADLALDVGDELLDLRRRHRGFTLLEAEQGLLVRLIREVRLEERAADQRDAEQDDQKERVLAEEAAARSSPGILRAAFAQRTTRSVRTRIVCGKVTPRTLAVARFATSSKRIGRSTGRSAGRAPRTILST